MIFNCLVVLQISGIRHSFNFPSNSENSIEMASEVEETLKRIQSHRGVIGTIVVNNEGIPIKTTLDNSTTVQYIGLFTNLIARARSTVRDLDPQNDLLFLRIGSVKYEIMCAHDGNCLLIVIQQAEQ
ncbi:Dynein light chain roadblock-type 2 [Bulinus truncatus]|nr:Dynein light chain roadblock-type 2 [Bulinus truncatus]